MRYGLLIDTGRCIGCYSCVVSCKNFHRIAAGKKGRRRIEDVTTGDYPKIERWIYPVSCMHCDNAPCIAACNAGAITKRKDGIITIDKKKCNCGVKPCISACPFDALYYDDDTKAVDGCDFCADRVDLGLKPICVEVCPGRAMTFGDLSDPKSGISRRMKSGKAAPLKPESETQAKVYYENMGTAPLFFIDRLF